MGSTDKIGGFKYYTAPTINDEKVIPSNDDGDFYVNETAKDIFEDAMRDAQYYYDRLRKAGVPGEDARLVLPNAATCNLVLTCNLRAVLEFYEKRKQGNGAQLEIAMLSEELKNKIIEVDPWVESFFG
ncbi:FAD-dependent thymidylate synthase [compost metagenome]